VVDVIGPRCRSTSERFASGHVWGLLAIGSALRNCTTYARWRSLADK
jgi:hypothetical protein